MASSPRSIVALNRARKGLADVRSLDDILSIRDKAEAVRHYAKSAQLGLEIQNEAAIIKLEAERKAGAILSKLAKNRGQLRRGGKLQPRDITPTLDEQGITKTQSHRWQLEFGVPEKRIREFVNETRAAGREVTSSGLIKVAKVLMAAKTGNGKFCRVHERTWSVSI